MEHNNIYETADVSADSFFDIYFDRYSLIEGIYVLYIGQKYYRKILQLSIKLNCVIVNQI